MNPLVTLKLEKDTIRFTPDGRIAVIDAIGALSDADCSDSLWEDLKRNHPEIIELCGNYTFPQKENTPVANIQGWTIIETTLLEHLIDNDF